MIQHGCTVKQFHADTGRNQMTVYVGTVEPLSFKTTLLCGQLHAR
jgi:hypothetical protein